MSPGFVDGPGRLHSVCVCVSGQALKVFVSQVTYIKKDTLREVQQ